MSGANPLLLFLDFDGVTHPFGGGTHSPYHTRPSTLEGVRADPGYFCADNVAAVNRLAGALDAAIVISSAWRLDFAWHAFNDLFEGRVVGQTPWIEGVIAERKDSRYREVLRYLAEHRCRRPRWLAVDDNRELYPHYAPAHLTDPARGLTAVEAEALIVRFGSHRSRPPGYRRAAR